MAAVDEYGGTVVDVAYVGPARVHFDIVPHASNDNPYLTRAVYVGVGGDIAFVTKDSTVVVWKAVPQGAIIPVRCKRVNAIGTTASSLVGLY